MTVCAQVVSGLPAPYGALRRVFLLAAVIVLLSSCNHNRILRVNPHTGYFSEAGGSPPDSNLASVTVNIPVDLDSKRSLAVVPDKVGIFAVQAGEDFTRRAIAEIAYFDAVMNTSELFAFIEESGVEGDGLSAALSARDESAAMQSVARAWQPFLWLRWGHRRNSKAPRDEYYQLILTDALTLEDYFVVETEYKYTVEHHNAPPARIISHQHNHYPMINALIDYIRQHSRQYRIPSDNARLSSGAPPPASVMGGRRLSPYPAAAGNGAQQFRASPAPP